MRILNPWLALLTALIIALVPLSAFGLDSDEGPQNAIVAIRHDLPILLADELAYYQVRQAPIIEWVVSDGLEAVGEWRAGQRRGIVVLRFRSGKWWWRGAASSDPDADSTWTAFNAPGTDLSLCQGSHRGPPSAHDLLAQGFINAPLAARVSPKLRSTPQAEVIIVASCDSFGEYYEGSTTDGYDAGLSHDKNDLPVRFTLNGHGPADWQPPVTEGSELYYAFTLSAEKPARATLTAGSTFDVWFPFVLDTRRRYTLRVRHVVPEVAVAPKSTKNNVLHFVLPAFEIPEGNMAQGEIDAESQQAP